MSSECRWIRVGEQEPENFQQVLVTNGIACQVASYSKMAGYDTPAWMTFAGRFFPTHWMPLPEPPK